MGDVYITELVDVLSDAKLEVSVHGVNDGWEDRSRSSGGFPEMPLGCVWHHTASDASPEADLNYMINGSENAPIGNMLIDRNGVCWPIAAGAANTQGKGGPYTFSRGVCPLDEGNSRLWGIEVANTGVGEMWPVAQIDAYFAASNALNKYFGNSSLDVITHHVWAPDRKIDPATALSVEGPWTPAPINSSGTWSLSDVIDECVRRGSSTPTPTPTGDMDMIRLDYGIPGDDTWWTRMLVGGCEITWVQGHANDGLDSLIPAHIQVKDDQHMVDLLATFRAVGPVPSTYMENQRLKNAWEESSRK